MKIPVDSSGYADPGLVEMLLEMSDEEIAQLERIYEATAHVREESGLTPAQKSAAINQMLAERPELRAAFEALTGASCL